MKRQIYVQVSVKGELELEKFILQERERERERNEAQTLYIIMFGVICVLQISLDVCQRNLWGIDKVFDFDPYILRLSTFSTPKQEDWEQTNT